MDTMEIVQRFLMDLKKNEKSGDNDPSTIQYINLLESLNIMMSDVKDKHALRGLVSDVNKTLDEEYFTPYKKMKERNFSSDKSSYNKAKSKDNKENPDVKIELGMLGFDINDIPKGVREKLADVLSILGLPDDEVKKDLGL